MIFELGRHLRVSVSEKSLKAKHKTKDSFVKAMLTAHKATEIHEDKLKPFFEDIYDRIVPPKKDK